MEKIRGKTLKEWKEYCKSDNVPIKTMKYITCLEERIKQLTLTDVVRQSEQLCQHKYQDIRYGTSRCVICGEEEQSF
jgi:hypothetical protein